MSEETRTKSADSSADALTLAKIATRTARARGGTPEEQLQRILDANADVAEHLAFFRDEARAAVRDQQAAFRELVADLRVAASQYKGAALTELERLQRERKDYSEHARELASAAAALREQGSALSATAMKQWKRQFWSVVAIGAWMALACGAASCYVADAVASARQEDMRARKFLHDEILTQQDDLAILKKKLGVK